VLVWLLSCAAVPAVGDPTACDARVLHPGEVRVRRIPCTAELIEGGEGRRSDWLLENDRVRFVFRDVGAALTRLDVAGGTLIDAATPGGADVLVEAIPDLGTGWLVSANITPWSEPDRAGLTVSGATADGATLTWALAAESVALDIPEAEALTLVPLAGAEVFADAVEDDLLLLTDGALTDHGGWVTWTQPGRLIVAERDEAISARWSDAVSVDGTSDGEWVEARDADDAPLVRLPVTSGVFSGLVPSQTDQLIATASGASDGAAAAAEPGVAADVGAWGEVVVRAVDDAGADIPAQLWWGEHVWPVPPGGATLPVGPGTAEAWLWAGPGYERADLGELTVSERARVEAVLDRAVERLPLAELSGTGWPDRTERRPSATLATVAATRGVDLLVLSADDEVAIADVEDRWTGLVTVAAGTRAATDDLGDVLVWPWSRRSHRAAHGAMDWRGLEPLDLLAALAGATPRWTRVGAEWVAAAPTPALWTPTPTTLHLTGPDDLEWIAEVLDRFTPTTLVGPLTWLDGRDDSEPLAEVDLTSALVEGSTIAGNGPQLLLRVDDELPGAWLPGGRVGPARARLEVRAPSWIPLTEAALIGTAGETLYAWTLPDEGSAEVSSARLRAQVLVPRSGWLLAMCTGDAAPPHLDEPAWAITSPIWLERR